MASVPTSIGATLWSYSLTLRERLLLCANIEDRGWRSPCWIWQGHITEKGYGRLSIDSKRVRAHRASYECFCGPIPDGLVIDHLCRQRACINPDHLEVVTTGENNSRSLKVLLAGPRPHRPYKKPKPATHCKRGHPFTPENTMTRAGGGRRCRYCDYARRWIDNPTHKGRRRKTAQDFWGAEKPWAASSDCGKATGSHGIGDNR